MNDGKAGGHIEKAICEASYFSKIRVVGHPKNDEFQGGRMLCCRWCSEMFIGYK